jgi:uncharacterized membrane protein YfcA
VGRHTSLRHHWLRRANDRRRDRHRLWRDGKLGAARTRCPASHRERLRACSETFTTGASGLAHWHLGNVDRKLLVRLAVPGMIGGAIGAYVLAELPGEALRPFISAYLLLLGVFIVWKAIATRPIGAPAPRAVAPLGLFGGLVDAIGGGGWGPIVTSTLLGQGTTPRYAIGSVNLAEFFVTLTISTTFFLTVGLSLWPIIAGLIIGGIIAAPFAAIATKHIPDKVLMLLVGCVVVLLSLRTILMALAPTY